MQKKLIALAVAALASTGAMAQVTFYGVLDAGVVRATGEQATGADQKFNGIRTGTLSGSRLGFTAEEDLGDGLKAVGRAEFGTLAIDTGTGNGINNTRQSFVGLSSATAGTVVFGRVQTPGYDAGVKHDALGGSPVFSPYGSIVTAAANSQTVTAGGAFGRVDNAIGYVSPKLGGAVVKALVARTNSELAVANNGDLVTASVEFSAGPLDVSGAVARISEFSATQDHTDVLLGLNYNLGVAKLLAQFIATTQANDVGSDVKGRFFQIGAQVPVGKGTIKVAVGRGDTDRVSNVNAADPDAATMFGLDYEHAFGKRTTGYVGVSNTKVGDKTGISIGGVSASADKSITAVGAGLRLTF